MKSSPRCLWRAGGTAERQTAQAVYPAAGDRRVRERTGRSRVARMPALLNWLTGPRWPATRCAVPTAACR